MKILIEVPYIDQTGQWPTGCESVSSVMLLHYLGCDISVDDFIQRFLAAKPMTWNGGALSGPDPDCHFAGSPYDPDSFGCYPGVIVSALGKVFSDRDAAGGAFGYRAEDVTGMPVSQMVSLYIDRGMPVVFWASIDLKPTYSGPEWTVYGSGETFTWTSNEHCMLLVGYDTEADKLIFNDPWNGNGVIAYDRELVLRRHEEQGRRAVAVICQRRNFS